MTKLSHYLNILIVSLVLLIAGALFYLKNQKNQNLTGEREMSSLEKDAVVNKYLKETTEIAIREKIKTDAIVAEARKKIIISDKNKYEKEQKENEKIPLERQIWKEPTTAEGVSEINNLQMAKPKSPDNLEGLDKKEYARQFIENARREGYHIELSEDLEVIKVTPIRKPSQINDEAYPSE